ncbi:unnamed protein product [Euphydryas editha]|uniref:Reverse transcriptase domain-containing protein n=1 Tax=Euphydryas editha TaxID=104508 RepID=A0AAU9V4P9_EUPED|nr:unnamed protein product [Euphydryas editha]
MSRSGWGCCLPQKDNDDDFIMCSKCKKRYHLACMSLDVTLFSTEMRTGWTCPECSRNTSKSVKKDHTSVRNVSNVRGSKRPALHSPPTQENSSISRDDLREAMEEVMDKKIKEIFSRLENRISTIIDSKMKPLEEDITEIKKFLNFTDEKYEDMKKEVEVFKLRISDLEAAKEDLSSTVNDLNRRINQMEQQSRQNNIELQCVPENRNENLIKIVCDLGKTVGCQLKEIDILNCTRTAKLKRSSPRPRSIVVQLSSPRLRDELLAASIKYNKGKPLESKLNTASLGLPGDRAPVFVCEHLSPTNKVLHAAARKRAKEAGYNGELFDERYVVYRRDRSNAELIHKKEGGGVLVAVSRRILSKRMYSWESKLEDLWVILEIPISHTLRRVALCAVYLPPPVHSSMLSHFIESCSVVLDNCDCYCILGDFNLACIDWSLVADTSYDYKVPSLCQPLIDLLNLYELKQHNNELNKSNRILDLVMSNLPACMVRQSHSTFSNIDQLHPPLDVDISFIREPRLSFNHQTFKLNFYKADFLNINKELQGCDWVQIFGDSNDVNTILDSETLLRKLKNLDESKGAGPDGIPPIFIKRCATYLVEPLLRIFNMSLQTGTFPTEWKKARVVPIHKANDDDIISNYRPISILSTPAKVLESLICPFVQRHFKQSLCIQQHGFVPSRSTCTNLVDLTENLAEALDCHKQVDVVYTDFSKAFDRLPHGILLNKLSAYGICGNFLRWVRSYLEGRTFSVVVNGFHSNSRKIVSGVPQGSHLGPILFTLFINDLPTVVKFSKTFMYADDLKIARVINTIHDSIMLQKDLDELFEWCLHNEMYLNPKKCFFVRYGRKRNFITFQYHIARSNIQELEQIRDLGVLFDKKLTFVPHIEQMDDVSAHRSRPPPNDAPPALTRTSSSPDEHVNHRSTFKVVHSAINRVSRANS